VKRQIGDPKSHRTRTALSLVGRLLSPCFSPRRIKRPTTLNELQRVPRDRASLFTSPPIYLRTVELPPSRTWIRGWMTHP
jgi:hypothetical protein